MEPSWDRGKANWSLLHRISLKENCYSKRPLRETYRWVYNMKWLIQVHTLLLLYSHSSKEKPKLRNATKPAGRSKQGSGWREDKAKDGLWKRCQLCHAECLHLNNSSHWLQGLAEQPVCPILLPRAFTAWGQREVGAMATSAMWLLPFTSTGKAKPKKMRF